MTPKPECSYVIAKAVRSDLQGVVFLPDAEHIHLHRRADGTWHADAMRLMPSASTCVVHGGIFTAVGRGEALMDGPCSQARHSDPPCEWRPCWADAPKEQP